jgi:hypothetical protein
MDINDVVKTIGDSDEFKEFIKDNPENYLVHLFSMMDAEHKDDWQVGYYSKKSDKITVFELDNGKITVIPAQEAFKEKNYIAPLKVDQIKVTREEAMAKVQEIIKENYSAENFAKAIVLLQNLPEYKQLWNITMVTATFNVINVKINAITGELIKHSKESLIGWNKK